MELGSFVSFKDRKWWKFVGGCHGGAWKLRFLYGSEMVEVGGYRESNKSEKMRERERERERDYVKVIERNYKKIEEK